MDSLKVPKGRKWKRGKRRREHDMKEKRNQMELLWFQTGRALNFITAAPHCGLKEIKRKKERKKERKKGRKEERK
jgi:hypothetical protein